MSHGQMSATAGASPSARKLRAVALTVVVVSAGFTALAVVPGAVAATNVQSTSVANQPTGPSVTLDDLTVGKTTTPNSVQIELQDDTQLPATPLDARDISSIGASTGSKLWVNMTVDDFSPTVLMGSANVTSWQFSQNGDGSYDINVSLYPSSTERNETAFTNNVVDPSNWDPADHDASSKAFGAVASFQIYSFGGGLSDLEGARLNTDAQAFTVPTYSDGNLTIDVASPHCIASANTNTCSGSDVNDDGFYEAVVPETFINNRWGSDFSPSTAKGVYSSSASAPTDVQWTITELDDGSMKISADNIHYSTGAVTITEQSGSSPSSSGGGISGTTASVERTTDAGTAVTIDDVSLDSPTVEVPVEGATAGGFSVTNASMTFDMGTTADNDLTIEAAESPPPDASDPAGDGERTLGYVTVEIDGNLADRVTEGSFTLDLDRATLGDAAAADVTVKRYHDGAWQVVETRAVDDSTVEVLSPGFSTFAIGAPQTVPRRA